MPTKKKGLFAIGIFTLGLLLGLAIGSFTGALPKSNLKPTPNVAEGAEIFTNDLTGVEWVEGTYQGYLGVYSNHLAIYDGMPPNGELRHIMTDYEVRDDIRPQLEVGIPFTDTYDLLRLLENYTS